MNAANAAPLTEEMRSASLKTTIGAYGIRPSEKGEKLKGQFGMHLATELSCK